MADKKSLFAGRTGDKTSKQSTAANERRSGGAAAGASARREVAAAAGSGSERRQPLPVGKGGIVKGVAATQQNRDVQVKEANDYLKQANKMLTKTMTRWNPDFFGAAPLFEKAGACYRAAGEDGKATAMYVQAGECQCHDSVLAYASAARDFREAALITERQGRNDEASALYLKCAEAWVHGDEPGRAADYFGRSAKLVKDTDEDAAAERYIIASKVMVPTGSDSRSDFTRVVGANEVMVQAITFLASAGRLEESIEVVSRYIIILQAEGIEHSLGRMYLTYCVLALALGDFVRADAAFRDEHLQSTEYLRSEECRVEEELLTAFKDYRPDLLRKVQDDRTLRRLETVIVRLAKSLSVPGDDEDDGPDLIPARETPSGTISDAEARVQALKEKYGGGGGGGAPAVTAEEASARSPLPPTRPIPTAIATTPSSCPPTPPPRNPKSTSEERSPTTSVNQRRPRAAAAGTVTPSSSSSSPSPSPPQASDDPDRNALFSAPRKAKAAAPPPATSAANTAGSSSAAAAAAASTPVGKFPEESSVGGAGDAEVDLGLGDLEASLGVGESAGFGGDDDDDLEAMIEAARKEAEALALGGEGEAEESDEDDIDLT